MSKSLVPQPLAIFSANSGGSPLLSLASWKRKQWRPQPRPPVTLCPTPTPIRELTRVKPAPQFNPEVLHLPNDYAGHPVLSCLLNRWLKNLQPKPCPTRTFRERSSARRDSTPDNLTALGNQIAQVLDIEPFAVVIGGREAKLYAEIGLAEQQVCICHPDVVLQSRAEQRFLMLRAVYAHFQKHNALMALAQNWNEDNRNHLLTLFFSWNQRNSKPILNEDWSVPRNPADFKSVARLSQWVNKLFQKYQSAALADLRELLVRSHPFRRELDQEANLFATLACGLEVTQKVIPALYSKESSDYHLTRLKERVEALQSESL